MKIQVSKDKSVFYYYKRYHQATQKETIVTLPEDRTLYVCHFERPIEENFIQRFFGLVGRIKQVHLGEYKNKANNKRKRRTVYFALVVYKDSDDCSLALNDSKFLQSKANKLTKKGVKFTNNPF